ncbi:hypothetical protein [Lentibacillus sp. Marseille-P4043]|uniref:hypothetical protein n=1 Tax=Lentibacillus sp. Marseille-P4043 TaxID=2040293 RepID=UPI00131A5D83|nr:hypothetical protein [Lentibacillus sp. Marseille-P4043]
MKYLDWHMLVFVGVTLVHDSWIYWGFPQIEFWEMKQKYIKENDDKNDGPKAA